MSVTLQLDFGEMNPLRFRRRRFRQTRFSGARSTVGGRLMRPLESMAWLKSLVDPGDAHGAAKLPGARCRICAGCVVAVRFCIHQVSRRPVCRHDDRGVVGQLGAAANRLVVRVRDNNADRDVAPWWGCG